MADISAFWIVGSGGLCKCEHFYLAGDGDGIEKFKTCPGCNTKYADAEKYWKQFQIDLDAQITKENAEAIVSGSSSGTNPILVLPTGFTNESVKNLFQKVANVYNKDAKPFDDAKDDIGKLDDGTAVQKYFDFYSKQDMSTKRAMNLAVTTACDADDANECVKVMKSVADGSFGTN